MSKLFSQSEVDDMRLRALPKPTATATLKDLNGVVLFGAGRFCRALIPAMRSNALEPAWIVDNNPVLWGTEIEGIPIRSAQSLNDVGRRLVLVMTTHLKQMAEACQHAGVKHWTWFTDIHEVFGNVSIAVSAEQILADPEIDRLAGLLQHSAESVATLKKALMCRVTGDPKDNPIWMSSQYFPKDLVPLRFYERFVDCGAYDGDTLDDWARVVGEFTVGSEPRYYGFEPDPDNFKVLQQKAERIQGKQGVRIQLHECAVGDVAGTARIVQGGPGTGVYSGAEAGIEVSVVPLDNCLSGEEVTAVKMDVEGYEPSALNGAEKIIRSCRPALMISIYHRPEHLWRIPLWIHDLDMKYMLFLRHHDKTNSETVCYAVPN